MPFNATHNLGGENSPNERPQLGSPPAFFFACLVSVYEQKTARCGGDGVSLSYRFLQSPACPGSARLKDRRSESYVGLCRDFPFGPKPLVRRWDLSDDAIVSDDGS